MMFFFDMIGTIAFAISGVLTAAEHDLDIFGTVFLGLTVAVGGGICRDLILGITPPSAFVRPVYAMTAIAVSVIMILPGVGKLWMRNEAKSNLILLITDSLGLGVFTVNGIQIAYASLPEATMFLAVFVGVLTGVGGGIMRDLFAGAVPAVFYKHFYATASIIGACLCCVLWRVCGENIAMAAGAAVIIVLRLLAAKFRWTLPRPTDLQRDANL